MNNESIYTSDNRRLYMDHIWKLSLHKNAKDLVATEKDGPLKSKCWIVISHTNRQPLGRVHLNYKGKIIGVSRIVYMIETGIIPKDKIVRHECDDPICVNPEHLLIGTKKDNTQDMLKRDRHKHGEKASWSKLTINAVRLIRELSYQPGMFSTLALLLDVKESSIRDVYYGRTWKHDK